ncbi:hypothetical protein V6N11_077803 [Hibiscus sabdariffa]|uniref:Uncharacterized protein n=1 Tax=Hibiscus sabdariffa TaxID=183260 RepID=A0ABR2TED0_9ROSI
MDTYKTPQLIKNTKEERSQQPDKEVLALNEDQGINEAIKNHSLVEAKGKKKHGGIQLGEQIRTDPVTIGAEGSKTMIKNCGFRIESPKGISSAIIPISKEDHESTKGKSLIINASDNQILAGKEDGDGYTLSNNPLKG